MQIVEAVAINGRIGRSCVTGRSFDQAHRGPFRNSLGGDVIPGLAAVTSNLNQAIVGTNPNGAPGEWRLHNVVNSVVVLDARVVFGQRAARRLLLALVVAG